MPPKNPLTASDSDLTTDADNLFTGGGSQMFANERIETRKKKTIAGEQAKQRSELVPISNDLLKRLESFRKDNQDVGSYLRRIYSEKNAPKIDAQQIEIEFRARELNLQLIDKLESWIRARIRNQ